MNPVRSRKAWIFSVVLLAALGGFAADAGSLLVVNDAKKSDVILVLAGETDYRPRLGLQLLNQGYGGNLILDVPAAAKIYGYTQIQLAEEYFQSVPEASSVRICPIIGLSTRDESHDVEGCLKTNENRILLVTSDYHTRRALSIFRQELPRKSFSVAAAYDPSEFGTGWWMHREWAKTCLYEWVRLGWWNLVDRWR
jgi:hypothetical protein